MLSIYKMWILLNFKNNSCLNKKKKLKIIPFQCLHHQLVVIQSQPVLLQSQKLKRRIQRKKIKVNKNHRIMNKLQRIHKKTKMKKQKKKLQLFNLWLTLIHKPQPVLCHHQPPPIITNSLTPNWKNLWFHSTERTVTTF